MWAICEISGCTNPASDSCRNCGKTCCDEHLSTEGLCSACMFGEVELGVKKPLSAGTLGGKGLDPAVVIGGER